MDEATPATQRLVSLPFALTLLAILTYAVVKAYDWQRLDNYFPHIFGYTAITLVVAAFAVDLRGFRMDLRAASQSVVSIYASGVRQSGELAGIAGMCAWFATIFAGTYLVGQMIAFPIFMLAYLRLRTAVRWRTAVIYAVLGWALLYGMFDQVIHIVWYPSLLLF